MYPRFRVIGEGDLLAADFRDYHEILGLPRDATDEDIKRAYRRLAREHHPDRNPALRSADRMKEINAAYETLSDPERRRAHDRVSAPRARAATPGPPKGSSTRPPQAEEDRVEEVLERPRCDVGETMASIVFGFGGWVAVFAVAAALLHIGPFHRPPPPSPPPPAGTSFISSLDNGGMNMTVPDLTLASLRQAKFVAASDSLVLEVVQRRHSLYHAGTVLKQWPRSGEVFPFGDLVRVRISSGFPSLPNLHSLPKVIARIKAASSGG